MVHADTPVAGALSPNSDGLTLDFATGTSRFGVAPQDLPFEIWTSGRYTMHNRPDNAGRWGSFGLLSAGMDYLLTDRLLIGLSLHIDQMTDPGGAESTIEGMGWLVGPYVSAELGDGVFFDTSLLLGGSSNRIDGVLRWDVRNTPPDIRWAAQRAMVVRFRYRAAAPARCALR
jgi:hypothetical protein